MEVMYKMTPNEVEGRMRLIGETYKLGSGITKTGRGRRLYASIIPDRLDDRAKKMIEMCKYVYSHGASSDLMFTLEDIEVLDLLARYCMRL